MDMSLCMEEPQNENKEETIRRRRRRRINVYEYPAVNVCKYLYFQGHYFWILSECVRWAFMFEQHSHERDLFQMQLISLFCLIYELIFDKNVWLCLFWAHTCVPATAKKHKWRTENETKIIKLFDKSPHSNDCLTSHMCILL